MNCNEMHDRQLEQLLQTLYHPQLRTIEYSLERYRQFLDRIGNPQERLPPVIHVAGTNGKGSLLAYLKAILQLGGLRVHRYSSPHLVRFNERIELAGNEVSSTALIDILGRLKIESEAVAVTFFEITTAAALHLFAEHPADVLLLETGMGGRLDATNVVERPLLTAITPISIDHAEFLGDTLEKIAFEKAGILKPGVPCVVGPQLPEALRVIRTRAQDIGAPLFVHGEDWHVETGGDEAVYYSKAQHLGFSPGLHGAHQYANAATAIACMDVLEKWQPQHIAQGILQAHWPARLQRLQCGRLNALLPESVELWLDGGHNPEAGEALARWAQQHSDMPLMVICGMVKSKDSVAFLRPLAAHAERFVAIDIPAEPLSKTALELLLAAHGAGMRQTMMASGIAEALAACAETLDERSGRVLICGSLYLAGAVLKAQG